MSALQTRGGVFGGIGNCADLQVGQPRGSKTLPVYAGMRNCPNPDCLGLVFVIVGGGGALMESFPPEVIDFDSTNLPPGILERLEEAIKSHAAGCYKASALMVRRALEELCQDKNATGNNLKERLSSLGSNIVVLKELLEAADELRILGNDAAHVEAKDYDEIGENEAAAAIQLAKEMLKAVYQYTDLLAKLRALRTKT